jgi:parallel beta-helix repeat protein
MPVSTGRERGLTNALPPLLVSFLLVASSFAILAAVPRALAIAAPACGDTITVSTTLTSDLGPCAGNGLVIGSDNITLDCGGHAVTGTAHSSYGIEIMNLSNVIVKNCLLSNFYNGILVNGGAGVVLSDNVARNNSAEGFYFANKGGVISGNKAFANENGFYVVYSTETTISHNVAEANLENGFYMEFPGNSHNVLSNNTASSNGEYDYYDDSSGSGTAGTANTYTSNSCNNNFATGSYPSGLCVLAGLPAPTVKWTYAPEACNGLYAPAVGSDGTVYVQCDVSLDEIGRAHV